MALFRSVLALAPVSEVSCPLPKSHPNSSFPDCRASPSSFCFSQTLYKRQKQKPRRNKLSKNFIGQPLNFKHLCHIEWSPKTGFDTNLHPELKMIFAQAGITQAHLQNKRTSKKIFETIEKRGGIEAVLEEARTKGLLTKSVDHPSLYSIMPSAPDTTSSTENELEYQTPRMVEFQGDIPAVSSTILKNDNLHSAVTPPAPSMPCFQRPSPQNLIRDLKEVQMKRAKSDRPLTPFSQDVLLSQIRKGAQLKTVTQNPTALSDEGIIAELQDIIEKRHKAIHGSDTEESDLDNGEEWDD
ncbi:actin nucleation-promoting factor WASL [Anolis carolinensis]|uniref:CRIB domain-containing protein n=1 Tax=Anolis carolinensis TaxID=28377 RepID=A0A803SMY7_ANOCA|nr:PREDICTED: neural Wiskott-Aldrich syndrome protein [Anolis carolinensis]|eukprot:XP_008103373.1 PREDICTED: neural Wiskott-Aldrich syndrome protein [Anolis carolinensis]